MWHNAGNLALALVGLTSAAPTGWTDNDLYVQTNDFTVQGRTSNISNAVRFFGNIPYAAPPIGDLRFKSPADYIPTGAPIDGSVFGPSCIQLAGGETVYTEYLSGFLLRPGQPTSEDCLTVNVWAPRASAIKEPLPVMIWIHGGGFTGGGAASPYKYGDYLVRDQPVIMVAMNYRLNIFGFPGAAALMGQHLNPGLEDQRKAVEWTYKNIAAFGGDPERMILFGQSAGGASVDKYYYAYPDEPLIQGFIPQSGMADGMGTSGTSNFSYVASQLGCSGEDETQFSCVQQASADDIIGILNNYNATLNGGQTLKFGPQADGLTSFADYDERRTNKQYAQKPSIISQVNNEGASLVPYNGPDIVPNQTVVDRTTCSLATIPGNAGAVARYEAGLPLWRTRYFGEWPNLNPLPWLGAYHSSDLPMIFGTYGLRGPSTGSEIAMSKYYQSTWVAFAQDPIHGLTTYGWPQYDASNGDGLIELGLNDDPAATFGSNTPFTQHCEAIAT